MVYKKIHIFNIRLNDKLSNFAQNHSHYIVTASIALLLLGINLFTTRLDTECNYLGHYYALMAKHPFTLYDNNPVSYRILTPLISYILGFQGKSIILTNLLITYVFIATVFNYYRDKLKHIGNAFYTTFAIILTLVTSTSIHCGGYTDILTYLIIFLIWKFRYKKWHLFLLFGIGLFNRESIIFLLPWFLITYFSEHELNRKTIIQTVFCLTVSFGIYYLFRSYIDSSQTTHYSIAYYIKPFFQNPFKTFLLTSTYQLLGLFSVFRFLWIVPIIAISFYWQKKQKKKILILLFIIVLSYSQLLIAQDTSRMFTLFFMILLIPIEDLYKSNFLNFSKWFPIIILINFISPQIYTAGHKIEIWHSLIFRLIFISI